MDKVTTKDLNTLGLMIEKKLKRAEKLGEDSSVRIQQGDKTAGYPFRIYFTGGELGSGDSNAPLYISGGGFLGWTKREAFHTLRAIDDTIHALTKL